MTKAELRQHVVKVFEMKEEELHTFAMNIFVVPDVTARYFLNKAVDMRKEELARREELGTKIVHGDFDLEAINGD